MVVAFLIAILIFGAIVFWVSRFVKEKNAEEKEIAAEVKKATPDPNKFR